jgi:hypothetical protein
LVRAETLAAICAPSAALGGANQCFKALAFLLNFLTYLPKPVFSS